MLKLNDKCHLLKSKMQPGRNVLRNYMGEKTHKCALQCNKIWTFWRLWLPSDKGGKNVPVLLMIQ